MHATWQNTSVFAESAWIVFHNPGKLVFISCMWYLLCFIPWSIEVAAWHLATFNGASSLRLPNPQNPVSKHIPLRCRYSWNSSTSSFWQLHSPRRLYYWRATTLHWSWSFSVAIFATLHSSSTDSPQREKNSLYPSVGPYHSENVVRNNNNILYWTNIIQNQFEKLIIISRRSEYSLIRSGARIPYALKSLERPR